MRDKRKDNEEESEENGNHDSDNPLEIVRTRTDPTTELVVVRGTQKLESTCEND